MVLFLGGRKNFFNKKEEIQVYFVRSNNTNSKSEKNVRSGSEEECGQ